MGDQLSQRGGWPPEVAADPPGVERHVEQTDDGHEEADRHHDRAHDHERGGPVQRPRREADHVTEPDAVRLLDELRKEIKTLEYQRIQEPTTVSIGVCVANADSILTNREMKVKANEAEQFAKENKKDCVVSYKPGLYRPDDRYVAARD